METTETRTIKVPVICKVSGIANIIFAFIYIVVGFGLNYLDIKWGGVIFDYLTPLLTILSLIPGIIGIVSGFGLINGKKWGKSLSQIFIALSFIHVSTLIISGIIDSRSYAGVFNFLIIPILIEVIYPVIILFIINSKKIRDYYRSVS